MVGSSHKTAPMERLESLSFPPEELPALLLDIQTRFDFSEVLFLSTCNRSEIYALSEDADRDQLNIREWMLELASRRHALESEHFYAHKASDAVAHLYGVTCGLDAMVLGETEITAQVQTALNIALENGTAGNYLVQLVSEANRTSKRIRNETALGKGTTSVASAAVHVAKRVFGNLGNASILIVGAGETGELVGKHVVADSPKKLFITNRTHSRAEDLAAELNATAVGFDDWAGVLEEVNVVVCATHSKTPLVTKDMVKQAVGPSASRILLLLDISLPHNIEKSVAVVDNVFLYDMNDLKSIVEKNLAKRSKEVAGVCKIIEEEQKRFFVKQATHKIGPLIRDLRESYEDVRKQELERFLSKFSEQDKEHAERLTRDLVNKLLHVPTVELRALGSELDENRDRLSFARRLFGLRKE